MTKSQITLEEALELVLFFFDEEKGWQVLNVDSSVHGNIFGDVDMVIGDIGCVTGDVNRRVWGNVHYVRGNVNTVLGNVHDVIGNVDIVEGDVGKVKGDVKGSIYGRDWKFLETPREKLTRLIKKSSDDELLKILDKLENN